MSSGVKLRKVFVWIGVMLAVALVAVAHLAKQHLHSRLAREVLSASRERDALATEVLLLETETRGLRLYPRLEAVARERLGLVNPEGTPVVIQPAGQVVAEGKSRDDGIRSARWKGFPR